MRRLDQDADGKLSFNEFYDAVSISRPDLKAPESAYASDAARPAPLADLSRPHIARPSQLAPSWKHGPTAATTIGLTTVTTITTLPTNALTITLDH